MFRAFFVTGWNNKDLDSHEIQLAHPTPRPPAGHEQKQLFKQNSTFRVAGFLGYSPFHTSRDTGLQ